LRCRFPSSEKVAQWKGRKLLPETIIVPSASPPSEKDFTWLCGCACARCGYLAHLEPASSHGVEFDTSRLAGWPAFSEISDNRYAPGHTGEAYDAYRLALDLEKDRENGL
jgi:hypothetical protein